MFIFYAFAAVLVILAAFECSSVCSQIRQCPQKEQKVQGTQNSDHGHNLISRRSRLELSHNELGEGGDDPDHGGGVKPDYHPRW